jgi:cytochrome c oxidase cbb3-type subunit III
VTFILRTLLFAGFLLLGSRVLAAQTPRALQSPFQRSKAELLLEKKLPCLGCHTIAGRGGRIGPDLSGVGARLDRARIRQQIENPRARLPTGIMPRVPMPASTLDLIVAYLSEQRGPTTVPPRTVVSESRPRARAQQLYQRHCAACHGADGNGAGWNAVYLDRPPARHRDARVMGTRTDDRLFDAIYAGGAILGGSARMPPFGQTLSAEEIHALVNHIRELCSCRQPAWANGAR